MGFNTPPSSNDSDLVSTAIVNQINVDGVFTKVVPDWMTPNVVYRVGDGTVHDEGWDNVVGNTYLDFYMPVSKATAIDNPAESVIGAYAVAPTIRFNGGVLQEGDTYYNTVNDTMYSYDGTTWFKMQGSQMLGDNRVKAIRYEAQTTDETLVLGNAITPLNGFSIDSLTIESGGSLTISDGSVYKVL